MRHTKEKETNKKTNKKPRLLTIENKWTVTRGEVSGRRDDIGDGD